MVRSPPSRVSNHEASGDSHNDVEPRAAGGRRTGELTSDTSGHNLCLVMPALVAGIHVFKAVPHQKAWMAGTSV